MEYKNTRKDEDIYSGTKLIEAKPSYNLCGRSYKTISSLNAHIAKYIRPEVLRKSETDNTHNLSTQTFKREDDVSSSYSLVKN